ncbi:MAG: hypothetical protein LBT05_15565 [Planctomycetaceae bacterium]|nr:hypothetical protein [Planctomycetaceae bacterium]
MKKLLKRILLTTVIILLPLYVYGGFYFYYYMKFSITETDTVCYLGDVREGFMNFMEKEHRWPICMDEVMAAPYNHNLLHKEYTYDLFSGLPFRCVTLRNYSYKKNPLKVLVTLYKPYRTKLWPYGEYKTMVMLSEGSICIISPDELEEIIPKEKEEKNNENWREELMKKAKER